MFGSVNQTANKTEKGMGLWENIVYHYIDVIMGTIASQITSLTIVYSFFWQNLANCLVSTPFLALCSISTGGAEHPYPKPNRESPGTGLVFQCVWEFVSRRALNFCNILFEISNVFVEIPYKISCPYIESCLVCWEVKIEELPTRKRCWNVLNHCSE